MRGDDVIGELAVTAPPGETLDGRARRALDDLLPLITTGVALARSSADLAEARNRLASVRLEERRVLRRELHDGLGPSLAGIRLGLQGARNLLTRDPVQTEALLAALQDELDSRVEDVRALSRSLLPPTLDTAGLGPALDELASRHREGGLAVEVDCAAADLRGDLAAAVYGIAVEAMMNVARHSGARSARVDVRAEGADLVLRVDDDGHGLAPDAPPGVGTRSMRERAEEQGGSLRIAPLPTGGTRVEARLPVPTGVRT
ncbi:sensor histidine kinase [Sporichthya polymorpha]|uniref:sensor histidine kinase n=1 Tax=Sporichthya polymorpha TaxID=35751 RepID=UPI000360C1AB|nr:histidine kinase [Sporichthya polymorpha]